MKKIKYYLQCPKCGKTIKLHNYNLGRLYTNTVCCYPILMRLVTNEKGMLPKFG